MAEGVAGPAFGIALPQSGAGAAGLPDAMAAFARRAEELGFDSVWTQEQTLGHDPSLEPVVNLAYVAACTRRVRLGTAAIIAPPRNPVVLAKQLASLDRLSGGRLIAGVALGDMAALYEASGVPLAGRGARLDEAVRVLLDLWTGQRMAPAPVQRPHPPLWFGAHSEAALARAVRSGQGWVCAGGASTEAFARGAARVRQLLPPGREFAVAKKVYVAVEDDADLAQRRIVEWFAAHWGGARDPRELAEEVAVFGDADACARQLARVIEAGDPDLVILNPVYDEPAQLERLVADVLPLIPRAGASRG